MLFYNNSTYYNFNHAVVSVLSIQNIILCVNSFVSFAMNIILFSLLMQNNSVQENVKFVSKNLCVSIIIHSVFMLYHCMYNTLYIFGLNDCVSHRICDLFQSFSSLSICVTILLKFVLSVNELFKTFQLEKDRLEFDSKLSIRIKISVFIVWLVAVVQCLAIFLTDGIYDNSYCHIIFKEKYKWFMWSSVIVLITIEVLSSIFYSLVYFQNKKHFENFAVNLSKSTLSTRFHLIQTINTNKVFFKIAILQLICYTSSLILRIWINSDQSNQTSIIILMINLQLYSFYHILFPYMCIKSASSLERDLVLRYPYLCILFGKKMSKNKVTAVTNTPVVEFRRDPQATTDIVESFWKNTKP